MKFKSLLFAVLLSTVLFSSCTKEADTITAPAEFSVPSLYVGTYFATTSPGSASGTNFYSFVVYPGGYFITSAKAPDRSGVLRDYISSGTWTLGTDNIFYGKIVSITTGGGGLPTTQEIKATFSKETGQLTNGTWMDTNNPNGNPQAGKFSTMTRVN